ncbi:hypothetical protein O6H91_16G007000 [Diphasiastrum complanatum]|uniref:Uncharacterized protein n=2 Tax=Diphasiastrum complanatum TaxID=34168 RepID=A0ACC2B9L4_DIPCM|nr:hypothetical protein O6H91_16G007000 [Diphasiastrum complanatum]KAJ7526445.1 hypothetical protein O6H91_16G007000 [Diphasiastrum complanatum]
MRICRLLSVIFMIITSIDAGQVGSRETVERISQIMTNETISEVNSVGAAAGAWSDFASLLNAHKGEMHHALSKLKLYFQTFGYEDLHAGSNPSDEFDNTTEAAVRLYQENFGLPVTGILDAATIGQLTKPRCGREDVVNGTSVMHLHNHHGGNRSLIDITGTKRFQHFPGSPSWISSSNLTYAFAPSFAKFRVPELLRRSAFAMAFAEWSAVVPLSFVEIIDFESADIKIDFVGGEHGDGNPFDGILGILAHAFAPEDGRFHLDSAEYWSVHVHREASNFAIDLQSVVVHEIGHLLGLAHSSDQTAIMFPSIGPKEVRIHLAQDDIMGVQELYGVRHVHNVRPQGDGQSGLPASDSPQSSIQLNNILALLALLLTHLILYYFIAD